MTSSWPPKQSSSLIDRVPEQSGTFLIMRKITLLIFIFLVGCASQPASTPTPFPPTATILPTVTVTVVPTVQPSPTASPVPSATPFPLPDTDPNIVACAERKPAVDDLYVVVTNGFGLSPDYVPADLVRLDKYLPYTVVYSEQVKVRQIAVDGLVKMIKSMQAAGLKPVVRSGYRGYYDQAAAYAKWEQQNPGRVGYISALPGHSEHQLGLAVDFSSPELAGIVGDPTIEYHSDFDRTSEGIWLAEHAQEYGFALSYPPDAHVWTGLIYEPWHYRYVGVDMATYLYASSQFLTQFLMQARPGLPCMPGK